MEEHTMKTAHEVRQDMEHCQILAAEKDYLVVKDVCGRIQDEIDKAASNNQNIIFLFTDSNSILWNEQFPYNEDFRTHAQHCKLLEGVLTTLFAYKVRWEACEPTEDGAHYQLKIEW